MNHQKGFTLIELLVVTTIIIVLSAIGVVSYMNSGESARDNRRKADMETVRQAMVLYRAENTGYPPIGMGSTSHARYLTLMNTYLSPDFVSLPYPMDPKTGTMDYRARGNAGSFCVCANMEGGKGNTNALDCGSFTNDGTGNFYCVKNP